MSSAAFMDLSTSRGDKIGIFANNWHNYQILFNFVDGHGSRMAKIHYAAMTC